MSVGQELAATPTLLTGAHPGPTLAEALGKAGIPSGAFVEPGWPDSSSLRSGFDRLESWNSVELYALPATLRLAPRALSWVRSLAEESPYLLFLQCREPKATPSDVDRELVQLMRDLERDRRLDRTMIVVVGDGDPREDHDTSPLPLVIYGPLPFRGAGARSEDAHRVDVFPTILDAFRHGPDYRLPGRALQKSESFEIRH
jgi:hypothetical protein